MSRSHWKLPLAALATIAALAGGAQLLLPATAGAEASDGPRCGGQFWVDLWCFPSQDAQGGGSEPVPACDESRGNYCVDGKIPPPPAPGPEVKANVGGEKAKPPRDRDVERVDAGKRKAAGAGTTACKGGKKACAKAKSRSKAKPEHECLVDGLVRLVRDEAACVSIHNAQDAIEKARTEMCGHLRSTITDLEARIDALDRRMADPNERNLDEAHRGLTKRLVRYNGEYLIDWNCAGSKETRSADAPSPR